MSPQRRAVFFAVLTFLACFTMLAVTPGAGAQTGPFVDAQPLWIGPGSSVGVGTNSAADSLLVDTNGNGYFDGADLSYPRPAAISAAATLRLSPTRAFLYAVTSSGGTNAWFYRLPPVNGAAPVLVAGPVSVPGGVAAIGFFDRPGVSAQRIAYVAQATIASGTQPVRWFDLATGVHTLQPVAPSSALGAVKFAPTGIEAFVQGALGSPGGTSNYQLVSLCAATFAQVANTGGGALSGLSGIPTAEIVTGGGGLQSRISCACLTVPVVVDVSDCSSAPSVGACCLPGGGCLDGVTASEALALGATWLGAGTTCEGAGCAPAPAPQLYIGASALGVVAQNVPFTYAITFGNSGTVASAGVLVLDAVPAGCTFVRASGGASYNALSQTLTWSVGTLAPGAARTESLVVRPSCAATSLVHGNYRIFGTPGGLVNGAPVITPVAGQSGAAVDLALTSTASEPAPLHARATITHTLQLTNASPAARTGLSFSTLYGSECVLDSVLDAGGGTVTATAGLFGWTGGLAANGSATVSFRVRVTDCRSASVVWTILGNGVAIGVRNACGATVGSVTPRDTFALAPPAVGAELAHTNPHRAGEALGRSFVRPGETAELELRVFDRESFAHASAQVSLVLPAGVTPASNPPFFGVTPAGANWDSLTSTITWSGALAAGQTVRVPLRVVVDSSACSVTLQSSGGFGSCGSGLGTTLALHAVPAPPPGDHLLVLRNNGGIWTLDAVTHARRDLLCMTGEIFLGFDAAPNGDIWVAGLPSFRFNPYTLDFEFFRDGSQHVAEPSFSNGLGLLMDVAVVPGTPEVDWLAGSTVAPGGLAVHRWNRQSLASVTLMGEGIAPLTSTGNRLAHGAGGALALDAVGGVLQLDPAHPGVSHTWTDASFTRASTVTADVDGRWLAPEYTFGTGTRRMLASFDPATGAFTEVVHDLQALLPLNDAFTSVAVAPNGDVYLAAASGPLGVLHRGATPSAEWLPFAGQVSDLAFVAGAVTGVDGPGAPPATRPATALAPVTPNPSTGAATVRFTLAAAGRARLEVLDLQGRRVATLADGAFDAGEHAVAWRGTSDDGRAVSAGVYFVRLETNGERRLRKLMRLR
jgi:uncharacterized repeat protein (TIGR01451 family)